MGSLRHHLRHRRWLAAWLVAATLLLKVLVPAGYMLDASGGGVAVELCSGYGPMTMAAPMPGMAHHGDEHGGGKAGQPCAFAALSAPALGGADPPLLAVALAFAVAAAIAPVRRRAPQPCRQLRPPLRGPPLLC